MSITGGYLVVLLTVYFMKKSIKTLCARTNNRFIPNDYHLVSRIDLFIIKRNSEKQTFVSITFPFSSRLV